MDVLVQKENQVGSYSIKEGNVRQVSSSVLGIKRGRKVHNLVTSQRSPMKRKQSSIQKELCLSGDSEDEKANVQIRKNTSTPKTKGLTKTETAHGNKGLYGKSKYSLSVMTDASDSDVDYNEEDDDDYTLYPPRKRSKASKRRGRPPKDCKASNEKQNSKNKGDLNKKELSNKKQCATTNLLEDKQEEEELKDSNKSKLTDVNSSPCNVRKSRRRRPVSNGNKLIKDDMLYCDWVDEYDEENGYASEYDVDEEDEDVGSVISTSMEQHELNNVETNGSMKGSKVEKHVGFIEDKKQMCLVKSYSSKSNSSNDTVMKTRNKYIEYCSSASSGALQVLPSMPRVRKMEKSSPSVINVREMIERPLFPAPNVMKYYTVSSASDNGILSYQ